MRIVKASRFRAALLSALLIPIGLVASATSAGAAAAAPAIWQKYAPLVYLYSSESKWPANASWFISHSSLRWSHDGCSDDQIAAAGSVSATKLGDGGYAHQTENFFCHHSGTSWKSNQNTRPYQSGGPGSNEGFFLDLNNGYRGGQGLSAPVYFDYKARDHITYWFFYAYNDAPGGAVANHEGDWERMVVRLNAANRPTAVAYYQHGGYCTKTWGSVGKSGTHPIGYSASGTHATYPTSGNHDITGPFPDRTNRGHAWRTWTNVTNVRATPFYGFGGAWGEVGNYSDTTGPMGPSAFKAPAPSNWGTSTRC